MGGGEGGEKTLRQTQQDRAVKVPAVSRPHVAPFPALPGPSMPRARAPRRIPRRQWEARRTPVQGMSQRAERRVPNVPTLPPKNKSLLETRGATPPSPPPPLRAATYLDGGGGKAPTTLAVPGTSAMVSASASSQCAALTPDDEQGSNRQAPVATADAPTGGVGGQRKEGADATGVRRPSRKPEHAVQARAVK